MNEHRKKVKLLQQSMHALICKKDNLSPIALKYCQDNSNTTRTKDYKKDSPSIDLSQFNKLIHIDPIKKIAIVEPRVTMEQLLSSTLPYGLAPPVLPEFKNMTIGGAIMGGSAESGSHAWGCFNDICLSHEILLGNGEVLTVSPSQNKEIYHAIASSYGSFGVLLSTTIQLIDVFDFMYLTYYVCSPTEAIEKLGESHNSSKESIFLDGIIFSKDVAVVIEGKTKYGADESLLPTFSFDSPFSPWFYQHVYELALCAKGKVYQEKMPIQDYFFRYDLGAFWMGTFLFHFSFFSHYLFEGVLGINRTNEDHFSSKDIERFHQIKAPPLFLRTIFRSILNAKSLWKLLHKAERWIQRRMIIQDFCIPKTKSQMFYKEILKNPAIFPIWLCPIKGTREPQYFSPHYLKPEVIDNDLMNFGLYGIASTANSIQDTTKSIEKMCSVYGGRKPLYSRSYYTEDEFWNIYSKENYKNLRRLTHADGIWHEIADKVLSS